MTAAEIVGALAAEGAHFTVDGTELRFRGPKKLLTGHLLSFIRERRSDLIEFLRRPADDLSVDELAALGYRQTLPDEVLDQIFDEWDAEVRGA